MQSDIKRYVQFSLVSTMLTGAFTSLHHSFEVGSMAAVLALIVVGFPFLTMRWFTKTGSRIALTMYGLLTAWLFLGFGLVDGLWNHTINGLGTSLGNAVASLHGSMPEESETLAQDPLSGNIIHQITGVLTFIASLFSAYYGVKVFQGRKQIAPTTNLNPDTNQGN